MMTGHRLRLASHWRRLDSMERKYDGQFAAVFDALRKLIAPPEPDRKVTLYGVTTKAFNQAVKRNRDRFPDDFMFQLTVEETDAIRSQTVTASRRRACPAAR